MWRVCQSCRQHENIADCCKFGCFKRWIYFLFLSCLQRSQILISTRLYSITGCFICNFLSQKICASGHGRHCCWKYWCLEPRVNSFSHSCCATMSHVTSDSTSSWVPPASLGSRGGEEEFCFIPGRISHFLWSDPYPTCSKYSSHIACYPFPDRWFFWINVDQFLADSWRAKKVCRSASFHACDLLAVF